MPLGSLCPGRKGTEGNDTRRPSPPRAPVALSGNHTKRRLFQHFFFGCGHDTREGRRGQKLSPAEMTTELAWLSEMGTLWLGMDGRGARFLPWGAKNLFRLHLSLLRNVRALEEGPPFPASFVELLPSLSEQSLTTVSTFGCAVR
uniref:Uncharacterized protein n=1 Tax=Pipistrellus kuhlii TaxID=59472 RepID=A0A7J8A864_PIPKU|nr:hypothetical protein mPipKuh1_008970 [Pipistrellus kuhlii]